MELKEIGKRIREKRLSRSWSQEELAEKLNLSVTYVGMIERGEKLPRLETFIKIINVLGASADEVLVDVINEGYKLRLSRYADQISQLDEKERRRIYGIIDAFLRKDW